MIRGVTRNWDFNFIELNYYFKYSGNIKVHVNRKKSSEEIIREAALKSLGKTKDELLTQEEIEKVTSLDLSDANLQSIDELKSFKNLEALNLKGNNISDITPLAELKNLSVLDLSNNNIYDLSKVKCLSELTNLKSLKLENQAMIVKTSDSHICFENPFIDEEGKKFSKFTWVNVRIECNFWNKIELRYS